MRDITQQLDSYQDLLDARYPAVTVREIDKLERTTGVLPVPHQASPLWRVAAFAGAFALILGLGAVLILVRGRAPVDQGEVGQPTVESTVPATPPSVLPTPPSTVPAPEATTTEAPATTVATTVPPATVPPLSSYRPGSDVVAAIDHEGRLVVAYWSWEAEALQMVRCEDPSCVAPQVFPLVTAPAIEFEGEFEPALEISDMVLRPDGSPLVVAFHRDRRSPTLHACVDPDCTSVESSQVGLVSETAKVAIAPDGTPRLVYYERSTRTLMAAICGDPLCDPDLRTLVTLDSDIEIGAPPSVHVLPDGRLVVGYDTGPGGGRTKAWIAVCPDARCSGPSAILTFEDAVRPRPSVTEDGDLLVWYRTGPPVLTEGDFDLAAAVEGWNLMMARCDNAACEDGSRIETGWDLLLGWTEDARILSAPEGGLIAASNYFSSEHCADLMTVTALDPDLKTTAEVLATYAIGGSSFDAVMRGEAVVLAFSGNDGRLHIVEVPVDDPGTSEALPLQPCPNP